MSGEGLRHLGVRAHPRRETLKLPFELQVGWLIDGKFMAFAACKDEATLLSLLMDIEQKHGKIDKLIDMRPPGERWDEDEDFDSAQAAKLGVYDNPVDGCPNCGRHRVMIGSWGQHWCEKCGWHLEAGGYDHDLLRYLTQG